MIHNFFSTPIYIDVIDDHRVSDEIDNVIPKLAFKNDWQPDNDTAPTTFIPDTQMNAIEDHKLIATQQAIFNYTRKYLKEADQNVKHDLRIQESWLNTFSRDQNIGLHEHGYQPNALSGVYYHKADSTCGMISFKSPNPFVISFPHRCDRYSNIVKIPPEKGMILLFPNWLLHKVEPNRTDKERVSLSFNIEFLYN